MSEIYYYYYLGGESDGQASQTSGNPAMGQDDGHRCDCTQRYSHHVKAHR